MTEEQTKANWLDKEAETLDKQTNFDGESLPALKLEENKVSSFEIDFSEPFREWVDNENNATKAIIPVTEKDVKKVWWLNKKNPIYKDIVHAGRNGQTNFKVMQTGNQKNTKYNLVKE